MSGTTNPFDFNTDPSAPGMLGLPVGTWQDIARFGGNLAQAANARTGQGFLANGTGLAGPLGAAITGTMDQDRANAVTRAGMGLTNAQAGHTLAEIPYLGAQTKAALAGIPLTQAQSGLYNQQAAGAALQNTLTSLGIPAATTRAQLQQNILQHPDMLPKLLDQFLGPDPSRPAQPAGPLPGPRSENVVPPDQRAPLVLGAVEGTPVPPAVLHGLIDYETGGSWNPASVNRSSHAFGLSQTLPSTGADPGYGVPPISPDAAPGEQAAWAAKYLAARGSAAGVKDWNDPTQVSAALAAYHGPQKDANGIDGQMYAQQVLRRASTFGGSGPRARLPDGLPSADGGPLADAQTAGPQVASADVVPPGIAARNPGAYQIAQAGSGPIPAPSQSSYTPDQAAVLGRQFLDQAAQLRRRADAIGIGSNITGLPLGDPQSLRQNAQDLQAKGLELLTTGPAAAAKAGNTPTDVRTGGMAHVMGPNGMEWIKNPQLEKQQMPDGSVRYVHISPAPPGSPEGTPPTVSPVVDDQGNPVVEAIPPNLQDARNKAYEDFAGKDADSYVSSKNTQGILAQMNEAADVLNKNPGFLSTGPTSPLRLGFASKVNDILRTAGLPTAFDTNSLGMWEELTKQTKTAGFELASHYEGHARQAASTIENATSAVPSEINSPVGFYKVSAGINEIAQQNADAHEYMQSVYDKQGDLSKANTDFYTKYPAQLYARRAISTTAPYPIKSEKELNRYLPGTYIKLPDGTLGQVPERPGAPGIPDYIKQHQYSVPTAETPTAVQQ